jgi:hypothetical protein
MATNINFSKRLGVPNGTNILISAPVVSCTDPDSTAFLTAAGITDPVISNAICNLVVGLKADGLWTQIDAIYPFVGGTAFTHKWNLKDPRDLYVAYRLSFFGGWRHDSRGIQGNGTNTYADTYFAGNVQTVGTYTPADYSVALSFGYNENIISCDSEGCYSSPGQVAGISTTNGQWSNYIWYESIPAYYGQGHGQVGAQSTIQYGYRNGRKVATNPIGGGSIFFRDTMVVGGTRYIDYDFDTSSVINSYVGNFTSAIQSFAYFSTVVLDDTETANLYSRIQTFQTALGRAVVTLDVSDPDAFAFLSNARIVDPVYSATQGTILNDLVVNLKTNSLWSKMVDVWPIISDSRNLFDYSEDFTNALWPKFLGTVTSNTVAAPNDSLTADTYTADGTAGIHQIVQNRSVISGNTYTLSLYARANTNNFVQLLGTSPIFGGNFWANFNLSTGTVGTFGAATTASIQNAGGGWYRCIITGVAVGTTSGNVSIVLVSSASAARAENNSLNTSIFLWGAQMDLGSVATTYQVNNTTYLNRIANQFTGNILQRFSGDNSSILSFQGGWTFALTGAKGNGTNAYAQGSKRFYDSFTAGNLHVSAYSRTAVTPSTNLSLWGSSLPFAPYNGIVQATFTNTPFNMNVSLGGLGSNAVAMDNTQGLIMTSATSTIGSNLRTYQNGVLKGTGAASTGLPGTFFVNAFNNNSTTTQYAPFELALVTRGTGLTPAEASTFNTIITTYQTALSRNV